MTVVWPEPRCELRPYQVDALAAVDAAWEAGRRRALIVLPPGAGKTLVGLAAAARLGRPTLILSPNTAIQMQWISQWEKEFAGPGTARIGTDRALDANLTSLTYQAVAHFDTEGESGEEGDAIGSQSERLSDRAKELVARFAALAPATLILDEAHHLVEVWGELLDEILERLPQVRVIGLTATPSETLSPVQAALTGRLLGPPVAVASIPALVKQGYLAPYAELAWLCLPTTREADWLRDDALRFAELQVDLATPGAASTDFFVWLDTYVDRMSAVEWNALVDRRPELGTAVMRFHHAELVGSPTGARAREEYRQDPGAQDWALVISEYVREVLRESDDPNDIALLARLRGALPSVGFTLGPTRISRGRSPVDRVVARSAAKTSAAVEIVAAEYATLADRLRALIVVDHERATATLPSRLIGVIAAEAGSAVLMASELAADPRLADLGVALVTGKTVAANRLGVERLRAVRPSVSAVGVDGLIEVVDSWSPREWVPTLTRLFETGELSVLVGTRALLGEGWDARTVTTLVDLSTATTPTSVVQTRGRSLRLDPQWPQKVAHTWSVVCVAPEHSRGGQDYDRFVRKHAGYFGLNAEGQVVAGVSHVDSGLSPFRPPDAADFDGFNASMLVRAEDRRRTSAAWEIGSEFHDRIVPAVQITAPPGAVASSSATAEVAAFRAVPAVLPTMVGMSRNRARIPVVGMVMIAALLIIAVVSGISEPLVGVLLGLIATCSAGVAWLLGGRRAKADYRVAEAAPGIVDYAAVVAEALGSTEQVRLRVREGITTVDLPGPRAREFADALDELLSAPADPRYVVARPILPPASAGSSRLARLAAGGHLQPGIACHAVPTVFGVRAETLKPFTSAWRRHIAATDPCFTSSPEGAGLLAAAPAESPAGLATGVRVVWD